MQAISDTINQLHLGKSTTFEGLTVFPLFGDTAFEADYLTLDEALEQEQARVIEVDEDGDVPNLLFENLGDSKVLLLDGDELIGAKQNRVINLTILVPAHTKIEIPVSCVEAGSWSYRSSEFSSAKRAMFSRARASKAEQVTVRMKRSGERYSDQSEVWEDVAECASYLNVDSPTSSMADMYEQHEKQLGTYREAFKAEDNQVGAVFAVNGHVQGVEYFDSPRPFKLQLDKLVGSYAVEAVLRKKGISKETTEAVAGGFLAQVAAAKGEAYTGLGEGEDVRLSADELSGGALVAEERVVHLAAFNRDPEGRVVRRRPSRWYSDE